MKDPKDKPDARWLRTRQQLIKGGRKVFSEQGVEAASVLDIIRAAGVSQPSFYNHFASKDELAREIAAEFFLRDKQAKVAVFRKVADPAEAIAINVQHTIAIAQEDPVIAWTLLRSGSLRELVISSHTDSLAEMIATPARQGSMSTALELDMTERPRTDDDRIAGFNIMPEHVVHGLHIHPTSTISGTYYVQTPKGCSGLKFEDPRLDASWPRRQRKAGCRPGESAVDHHPGKGRQRGAVRKLDAARSADQPASH